MRTVTILLLCCNLTAAQIPTPDDYNTIINYLLTGRYWNEALHRINEAERIYGTSTSLSLLKGVCLVNKGEYKLAEETLNNLEDSTSLEAVLTMAALNTRLGRFSLSKGLLYPLLKDSLTMESNKYAYVNYLLGISIACHQANVGVLNLSTWEFSKRGHASLSDLKKARQYTLNSIVYCSDSLQEALYYDCFRVLDIMLVQLHLASLDGDAQKYLLIKVPKTTCAMQQPDEKDEEVSIAALANEMGQSLKEISKDALVMLISDNSGSMGALARYREGKKSLHDLLMLTLRQYLSDCPARQLGACTFADDCSGTIYVPMTDSINAAAILDSARLAPQFQTPVVSSLKLAADQFHPDSSNKLIIFLTDGIPTCSKENMCSVISKLNKAGIEVVFISILLNPSKTDDLLEITSYQCARHYQFLHGNMQRIRIEGFHVPEITLPGNFATTCTCAGCKARADKN